MNLNMGRLKVNSKDIFVGKKINNGELTPILFE